MHRNRKLYAIIDSSGKQLGNHLFSDIGDYHREYGLIEIAINKKWGYMNREGQIVLECYSDSEYSLPGPSAVYNSLQQ
uniref:WG repeat-containing protein n=1 Tax=Alistipes sp. TaxID=1872444 RepID=UPI004056163E